MPPYSKHVAFSEVHTAISNASETLRMLPNVRFVTVGQKRTRGERLPEACATVYVEKKVQGLAASESIPTAIAVERGGNSTEIRTDVVQLKTPLRSFGASSGNVLLASDANYGICSIAFAKNGKKYVITNAHVASDVKNGGALCNMALIEPLTNRMLPLGPAIWHSPLSTTSVAGSDAAVIQDETGTAEPYRILGLAQSVAGLSHFVPGNTTYWFIWNGTEFYCSYPEPVTHPTPVDVDGLQIEYDEFWVLHMTKGASSPGQSGALICRTDNGSSIIACGIAFGGSAPDILLAYSFDTVFSTAYSVV